MKFRSRRYCAIALGLVAAVLVASACASSSSSTQPGPLPAAEEIVSETTVLQATSTTQTEASETASPSDELAELSSARKVDREVVAAFAERVGVELLVAGLDDETAVVWSRDGMVEIPTPRSSGVWSDGQFLYGVRWSADADTGADDEAYDAEGAIYVAMTMDGEVVCRSDEPLHHAARRTDGTYVMAIEQPWDETQPDEGPVPMEAVDCQNGERQPIEPVTFDLGESQTRSVIRVAGRTFTAYGDAEGNADVENEQGVSINGDDYAGYHTFNPNGSIVAYGEMTNSPHLSDTLVVRNTSTGEQLWRHEFEIDFSRLLGFTTEGPDGSKVVVGFIDDFDRRIDWDRVIDRVMVLDAATGELLHELAVGFDLIYLF